MSEFTGNYATWEDALADADGYDVPRILERVREGALKVKNGEAAYEMDSLTYDKLDFFHPFLAQLLHVASCKGNRLNVLDFGGSLGSTYYLYRSFFTELNELKWNIVEQPHFVQVGRREFAEGPLKFYYFVEDCIAKEHPDVILFSGSLQYLEDPYGFLGHVIRFGFEYILFDRTPFIDLDDRITLENVPDFVYGASYPAWFFNEQNFLGMFADDYELLDKFDSFESWDLGDTRAQNKGMLFRRKIAGGLSGG
ncbi:MAG TPA: methyltransferase, TIGR04325 family [Bacilli bacterium]